MKRLAATALMMALFALPAFAQRGGGHGGGGRGGGGFSGHSAGAFHGGFAGPHYGAPRYSGGYAGSRSYHFAGGPRYSSRYSSRSFRSYPNSRVRSGFRAPYTRPGYRADRYGRSFFSDRRRDRSFFVIPDWIGLGTLGCYQDSSVYDDSDDSGAPGCYDEQAPEPDQPTIYGGDDDGPPPDEQPAYEPPVYEPPAETQRPAQLPANETATTIVFKDGRPSEQVHNYALTQTTLYVLDQRQRDIPLDQIDLAATEKVNRGTGIEFRIPQVPQ